MPLFYLETSALLKKYRTEQGTDFVIELIENRRPDDSFLTSYFTLLEVEAAAARAFRGRLLSQRAYNVLLGQFSKDASEFLVLQPITSYTINLAAELARRYALRAGDAIHLATALLVQQAVSGVIVVGSDHELNSSSSSEGLQTMNPMEQSASAELKKMRK